MALTGAIGVGYVVAHMLGNLQVFEGAAKINSYAALLKSNIGLLWTARSILIAAVSIHIFVAYQLACTSQKSRPVGYTRWRAVGSDFASPTMRWTGLLLALFIIYHLLVSCPSHNVISPDPSDNQETESDGAIGDGRATERVEQVGGVAHAAGGGCFPGTTDFGAGRGTDL